MPHVADAIEDLVADTGLAFGRHRITGAHLGERRVAMDRRHGDLVALLARERLAAPDVISGGVEAPAHRLQLRSRAAHTDLHPMVAAPLIGDRLQAPGPLPRP